MKMKIKCPKIKVKKCWCVICITKHQKSWNPGFEAASRKHTTNQIRLHVMNSSVCYEHTAAWCLMASQHQGGGTFFFWPVFPGRTPEFVKSVGARWEGGSEKFGNNNLEIR